MTYSELIASITSHLNEAGSMIAFDKPFLIKQNDGFKLYAVRIDAYDGSVWLLYQYNKWFKVINNEIYVTHVLPAVLDKINKMKKMKHESKI